MGKSLDLRFGPNVALSGFTPAGIAAFSDLKAAAVIRELIQNSLDAALGEANENCAKVKFRRTEAQSRDIPGLDSYKEAFTLAVNTQTDGGRQRMPTQARSVVNRIKDALEHQRPHVLVVSDNGVGLDDHRMEKLLSDGASAKPENATGTFGNGHSVVVPASDLRYVLYGGCGADGREICAGEAIIASQRARGETYPRSSRGFFIEDFRRSGSGPVHQYATGASVPRLIRDEIKWIRKNHGHGAAVIIPYFNNFHDDRTLTTMIERAAACNFFQAIHNGLLVVSIEDRLEAEGSSVLNRDTLPSVLEQYKDEKRVRRDAFLSGEKANEGYEILLNGETHTIDTTLGKVPVRLQLGVGNSQVCLIRNGMWITDSIPGLEKHRFSDRQPFRALLQLEPTNRNQVYQFIQRSERPLHNALAIKQLSQSEARELRAAVREIRRGIQQCVPEAEGDSFSISGLLDVQFDGIGRGASGNRRPSFWGTPTPRPKAPLARGVAGSPDYRHNAGKRASDPKGSASEPRVSAHPSAFHLVSVPSGRRRQRVCIVARKACKDAYLRLLVDENVDATCDPQSQSDIAWASLSAISINGNEAVGTLLNGASAIRLGDLAEGEEVVVETSFDMPEELVMPPGEHPTLRVEVVQAFVDTADSDGETSSAEDADG